MKFSLKLKKKIIPEWQDAYLSYDLLKMFFKPFKKTSKLCAKIHDNKVKTLKKQEGGNDDIDIDMDMEDKEYLKEFEKDFQVILYSEIAKINHFFHLKMIDFKKEWEYIKFNCIIYMPNRHQHQKQEGKQIKNAIMIFYKKLELLMEYMNLNMLGVRKIVKKHHKICKIFSKYIEILNVKPKTLFHNSYISKNSDLLLKMKDEVKKVYLDLFFNKFNKNIGHKELKDITKTRIIPVWESYFYFLFCGSTLTLLIVILIMGWYGAIDPDDEETFKYIFPIFRGSIFIIIYIWLLGWNVYGWTRYHVNYRRIFKFNHHFSSVNEIMKRGTIFSFVFLITFIWYIILNENMEKLSNVVGFIDKSIVPAFIWILILGYLLFPIPKFFNWEGRKYFFKLMFRIFFLSFFVLDFTMSWATDQMVSFVTPIKDLEYTFCYYISRIDDSDDLHPSQCYMNTFIIGFMAAFIPVFYRMVQCVRSLINKKKLFDLDLLNFFKYFTTLLVSIFSYLVGKNKNEMTYLYLWICFASISTIYSFTWDLKMDWGLIQPNKKYRFLREKIIYPSTKMYYFAIIINFFLRLAWVLTISPGLVSTILRPELFTLIIGFLEMMRRAIWNFLRVEKEYIMNTDNYQALENYDLPYKFDSRISMEDNIINSIPKTIPKFVYQTMDRGDIEEEFLINFGHSNNSDMKIPLLYNEIKDNSKIERKKTVPKDELINSNQKFAYNSNEEEENEEEKEKEEEKKNSEGKGKKMKNKPDPILFIKIIESIYSLNCDDKYQTNDDSTIGLKKLGFVLEKEIDDDNLNKQLRVEIEKSKEFLESYQSIHLEFKIYYSKLDIKYNEFGKKAESIIKLPSILGVWLDRIVKKPSINN